MSGPLAILGPGTLGLSAAQWAAECGLEARLLGRDLEHAETGLSKIHRHWDQALAKGHLALVIITVINSAVAIYYYLQVVRKGVFGEQPGEATAIVLDWPTKILCVLLIVGIVWLGVAPTPVMNAISSSLAGLNLPL